VVGVRHASIPVVRGGVPARLASLFFGLFVCALGIVLILRADLGLSPWDVLHQGIADTTPLSFGEANIVVGVLVVVVAWRLGATVGFGTLANATCVGAFVELLQATDAIPDLTGGNLAERAAFLALGILAFGVGSAFYIGADMGAGPRDSLMLVVALRVGTRVGVARAAIEIAALGAGFALGGDVGVGTLAFALFVGAAVEASFFVLARSPLGRDRLAAPEAPRNAPAPAESAEI
jgi:uncharacterized membrane protein YczE